MRTGNAREELDFMVRAERVGARLDLVGTRRARENIRYSGRADRARKNSDLVVRAEHAGENLDLVVRAERVRDNSDLVGARSARAKI